MNRSPVAIDLFSGCGGISTGLLDAGIRVVAGFDHDRRAIEGFDYNHIYRGGRGHVVDLSKTSGSELLALAGCDHVDLIAGGPPCQPFSIIGKQKGLSDTRGTLIFDFVRLVAEIGPVAVMFENVPNIEKIDDGAVIRWIDEELNALGYKVSREVLFAADYGVPQIRRRLFVVGVRDGKRLEFPPPVTNSPEDTADLFATLPRYRTCRDALDDLPDVTEAESHEIPNHEATMHCATMLEAFAGLEPGKRDRKSFHDRLHPDRPAYTLRAGTGNFSPLRPVHYGYDRVVTVRESARLQSFKDDFIWPDTIPRLQQYRQVGNAVPPLLAKAVASCIARSLNWRLTPEGFLGDPASRPPSVTKSYDTRLAERMSRMRGASLGKAAM